MHLRGLKVGANLGNFCYFYSHLSLETVFPSIKLTQIYYINMSIFFFLKTGNLIFNCVPTSPTNTPHMKENPYNLTKYKIKETLKTQISQLFKELETIWKYSLGLYLKTQFSILYPLNSEKIEKFSYSDI